MPLDSDGIFWLVLVGLLNWGVGVRYIYLGGERTKAERETRLTFSSLLAIWRVGEWEEDGSRNTTLR
jgi:hypothetical protein